ncbi:hypothetical protein OK344_09610 [Kaistella sp. BT6-1-3]|uniref:SLH domain-containing protein n=1 Tax=Kaistella yananensis TaxID=2989820 RepID=A0ABT3JPR6_9FLAO|nr:hypothetical protein [Kaistella yananensis]MCW4452465.1 hypothetical protein [Kaistella yananensis]
MNTYLSEQQKRSHPYYRIMELKGDELQNQLTSWSRSELIDWLCWNDRNGVYTDDDSLREFGNILSRERAVEIIAEMLNQS